MISSLEERTISCGYRLQMISMLLYLSIYTWRDVQTWRCHESRKICDVWYTYTMNRWGEKCYTEYCTRNVLYKERTAQGTYCTLYKTENYCGIKMSQL